MSNCFSWERQKKPLFICGSFREIGGKAFTAFTADCTEPAADRHERFWGTAKKAVVYRWLVP
jgi:hypothetical protein